MSGAEIHYRKIHPKMDPFFNENDFHHWSRGRWQADWIRHPTAPTPPFVCAFRLNIQLSERSEIIIHLSADERYILFIDGSRIGRGPELGTGEYWYYESFLLTLPKGNHSLLALVWSFGPYAPLAQLHSEPGFLLAAEGDFAELLTTGRAPWETTLLPGIGFTDPEACFGIGHRFIIDGHLYRFDRIENSGAEWVKSEVTEQACSGSAGNLIGKTPMLYPAELPEMYSSPIRTGVVRYAVPIESMEAKHLPVRLSLSQPQLEEAWTALIHGNAYVSVPPNSLHRILIDLENYYCAYPNLVVSGGDESRVSIGWAEALFTEHEAVSDYKSGNDPKGNRDEIEGRYFLGVYDTFIPDGSEKRQFEPFWWQAGRYIEIKIRTGNKPLVIHSFSLSETRFPLKNNSFFHFGDEGINDSIAPMVRTLQMCAHETYIDCPYYERMMYAGDTRLEILVQYAISTDNSLPQKAIRLFDLSRLNRGLTQSRYPSSSISVIPPFSLWWISMIHDQLYWRGNEIFLKSMLPGARLVMETFLNSLNRDGLLLPPEGWNFTDWVPAWSDGCPPDGEHSVNSILNSQLVLVLNQLADLEKAIGSHLLCTRYQEEARVLSQRIRSEFYDPVQGLMADNPSRTRWSEHAQCMAVLSGILNVEEAEKAVEGMGKRRDMERTTIYFSHYLFETYQRTKRADLLFNRLKMWQELNEKGFKTTYEKPGASRSDCHAWGSHPLYHYYATICGVRPASSGFRSVSIEPLPGHLKRIQAKLVHPSGLIEIDMQFNEIGVSASIVLPKEVGGIFRWGNKECGLAPGLNNLILENNP